MKLPKISIIIPVYNVEPYITECLQSVMRQTYQGPLECIVVDDCGNDKSMEIAKRLIAEYDGSIEFRVLHHEKNLGLSCARNTGIDVATGDYLYFIDSDDYITNNCISILTSYISGGKYDIVVGNVKKFGNTSIRKADGVSSLFPEEGFEISSERYFMCYLTTRQVHIAAWNKLYNMEFMKKNNIRFASGLFYEDNVLGFQLACLPTRMFVLNDITYYYRYCADSIMERLSSNPKLRRDSYYQVLLTVSQYCNPENYIESQELYFHSRGMIVFRVSLDNKLPFKDLFYRLHQLYPYKPLKLWLSKKQNFHWYKSRIMWSLPTPLGFVWLRLKYLKNRSDSISNFLN